MTMFSSEVALTRCLLLFFNYQDTSLHVRDRPG